MKPLHALLLVRGEFKMTSKFREVERQGPGKTPKLKANMPYSEDFLNNVQLAAKHMPLLTSQIVFRVFQTILHSL